MAHEFAADRYQSMPYRRCGRSGLKLPAISLGLWQSLGEPGREEACREAVFHAFDHGVTHFDLANNYGPPPGNSEITFGGILRDMPRDELVISTKAGYFMWDGPYGEWGSKKYMVASLDQSLKRMGLEYVDILYHHRPDPDTPLDETLGALDQIVRQGKALYVGVSSYSGRQYCDAVETVQRHDWAPITIHQPYYNMFSRGIEDDLLPHTAMHGTGVIAFCPLAGGVLTDRYLNGLPADSRWGRTGEAGRKWYEDQRAAGVWDRVGALNAIAAERGQSLAQMALAWILRVPRGCEHRRVTSALIGASSAAQVADSLGALSNTDFTAEELARIDAACAI